VTCRGLANARSAALVGGGAVSALGSALVAGKLLGDGTRTSGTLRGGIGSGGHGGRASDGVVIALSALSLCGGSHQQAPAEVWQVPHIRLILIHPHCPQLTVC
jgi:hypothetical protein